MSRLLILLCISVVAASATDTSPWTVRGALESSLRYNSNLTLVSNDAPVDAKSSAGTELNGRLSASRRFGAWRLTSQLNSLANVHADHREEDWFFQRGRLSLRRPLRGGTLEVTDEIRHFTVPDRNTFDFTRNIALVSWRRPLDDRWQIRAGYEGLITRYPQSPFFDYNVHGVNVEARARWSLAFTTYALLSAQIYAGEASPQNAEAEASPKDGSRRSLRLGFDWLFGGRHSLSGTASVQGDEADLGVQQIGDIEGPESSQDNEAEFDLIKYKATLLYSVPLSKQWLLSSYAEWIRKAFEDEERLELQLPRRTDTLLLSATHLRYRVRDSLFVKLRYLFRTNRSSVNLLDYDNHVVSAGLEVRR